MKYTFSEGQWYYSRFTEFKDFESLDIFLKELFNEEKYLLIIESLKVLDKNFNNFTLQLENDYFCFSKE